MGEDDSESLVKRLRKAIADEGHRKAAMQEELRPLREAAAKKQADLDEALRVIDAIPQQAVRRQMLDAIGLTKRSAAPRPLEPIESDVPRRRAALPMPPPPDWNKWGDLGSMSVWLAVSLSLNFDPDGMPVYHRAGEFGEDPFKICPETFRRRLAITVSHLGADLPFVPSS